MSKTYGSSSDLSVSGVAIETSMTARKGVTATKFTVSKIDATVDIPDISSWKPLNF